MLLDLKRRLDYFVGSPLLSLLQVAARILGAVLRRSHDVDPVRTVLIVKFQGMGSLVLAKPALAALRRARPDTRVLFWGTLAMRPLAEQMAEFDEVLVLDDRSLFRAARSALSVLWRLQRLRLDWAVDLEVYSRLSSVLVTLTCARNRTGFALDQLRSRRAHTHLVFFNRYLPLGEAYERIIGQLLPDGARVDALDYGMWRFPLDRLPSSPPEYFVININAGDLALERRWPRSSFRTLIDALLDLRPNAVAVLIGHGASEVSYAAGIPPRDRLLDYSGKLSLCDTIRLIKHADLVVTNDTAPLHFALSTGAKLVGLFGPTRSETYVRPGTHGAATAHVPLYCSPCVHHWEPPPCGGDNQCMKRLPVATVLTLCCEQLGLPRPVTLPREPDDDDVQVRPYYAGLVYRRSMPTRA
jgi:ADP-heptose:LPS heptosyltransferase